jgi:uncharacterized protein involved in exopolysaccharide biosynthesis
MESPGNHFVFDRRNQATHPETPMNSLDRSLHGGLSFKRTLSLASLPSLLWRRKALVLLTTALIGLAGALASFYITPIYEVASIVSGQIGGSPQTEAVNRAAISAAVIEQRLNSQAQILQSEEVVRRTIRSEGVTNLFPEEAARAAARGRSPEDTAYKATTKALTVRVEPNTNLLRVSFRHTDPGIAVNFVKSLIQNFIDRNLELERDIGAVGFFEKMQAKYNGDLEAASAAFSSFSSTSKAFSIEEQRKLTLERGNALKAALALTRGNIAEKSSQIAALDAELLRIRPRALESRQLGLPSGQKLQNDSDQSQQPFTSDPPLLMVRVFQESVQVLVRLRSEAAGFRALEEQQRKELAKVDEELQVLSSNEAQFERLKRELELARQRVDLYAKRVSEQQLEANLNADRFSSIRVVQAATMPLEPVFPKAHLLIPLALLIGVIAGMGIAVLAEVAEAAEASATAKAARPTKSPLKLSFLVLLSLIAGLSRLLS